MVEETEVRVVSTIGASVVTSTVTFSVPAKDMVMSSGVLLPTVTETFVRLADWKPDGAEVFKDTCREATK